MFRNRPRTVLPTAQSVFSEVITFKLHSLDCL